jgi:hypothetical protein
VKISLAETATVMGRSERQVRYLIKTGKLKAAKEGGQWRIATSDLPLTEEQRHALNGRLQVARDAFEKGLEPVAKTTGGRGEGRRQYSVTDLAAFQAGQAIFREIREDPGEESVACRQLAAALTLVVRGCHNYQPADKASRFLEARELAATAVAELLLHGEARHRTLAERIEQELIPKLSGLVASSERRSRSSRFDRFGAGSHFGKVR